MSKNSASIGYSYIRFSTPEQLEGDSLRRQTEEARKWCERNSVQLDTNTTFRDLGRSGFTGAHLKNTDLGGLATFLSMVEAARIPKDSFLIVENADRLTRQGGWDAIGLFHKLVMSDIKIVILTPHEQIIDRNQDTMQTMWLLMELSRGHGESVRKRELVGKNWQRRHNTASKTKEPLPGRRPFWIDRTDHGYKLNSHAETVRLIFKLASEGYGKARILKHLRKNDIKPIPLGKNSDGFISPSHLQQVLNDSAVYGRCEKLDCDDYWPAALSKDEWYRVRAIIGNRKQPGGDHKENEVHLLKSLVKNRKTGITYYPHKPDKCARKCYIPSGKDDTELTSFPVHGLEEAVCDCVWELDWQSLFPAKNGTAEKILALTGEKDEILASIAETQKMIEERGRPIPSLVPVLAAWDDRIEAIQKEVAELSMKAASPKAELFATVKTILPKLKNGDTELRLKARSMIARIIDRIEVSFGSFGKWRMCWATVRFQDTSAFRDIYILYHKPLRTGTAENPELRTDRVIWDHNRILSEAEPIGEEEAFAYLKDLANGHNEERAAEKRKRKIATSRAWHAANKAKKANP